MLLSICSPRHCYHHRQTDPTFLALGKPTISTSTVLVMSTPPFLRVLDMMTPSVFPLDPAINAMPHPVSLVLILPKPQTCLMTTLTGVVVSTSLLLRMLDPLDTTVFASNFCVFLFVFFPLFSQNHSYFLIVAAYYIYICYTVLYRCFNIFSPFSNPNRNRSGPCCYKILTAIFVLPILGEPLM